MNLPETSPAPSPAVELIDVDLGSMQAPSSLMATGISWTVMPGDFWVVGGLQGTGKTNLLLLLAGLMPPARGIYRLFGVEMPIYDETRLRSRMRIGLVFESGQLFNQLTISENIAVPLRYHQNLSRAEVAAQVNAIIELLELGAVANSTPGALGRNWQKRAALARALALKPEVLLIDNPLSGLDLRETDWWLAFLRELSEGHGLLDHQPATLIATAADLRPWRPLARQLAVLREQHLMVVGPWGNLKSGGQMIRDLIGEVYQQPA